MPGLRRTPLTPYLVIACAAAFVGLAVGCRSQDGPDAKRRTHPVLLVIGVDGLEWNVALPLIQSGKMPNLESLMRRGIFGKLQTIAPAKSPVIWTSIATGKVPEKHGIRDFFKVFPNGAREFFNSRDRKAKAIWNIVSDAGRRAVVIGWWNTFPVDPINGIMVAQTNTDAAVGERKLLKGVLQRGVEGQVQPPQRQNEMLDLVDQVDKDLDALLRQVFGEVGAISSEQDRLNWDSCRWAFRADETYRRIALKLAAESPDADLFTVYFGTTDVVSHRFWRYREPKAYQHPPAEADVRRFHDFIDRTYVHADQVIGELVARFPPDTSVVVLSDHGFHAMNLDEPFTGRFVGSIPPASGGHADGPPGIIVLSGPRFAHSRLTRPIRELTKFDLPDLCSALDVTPTLLAWFGLPVGRDMDGKVVDSLFTAESLEKLDVELVATHDDARWLASRGAAVPASPEDAQRIEQLRALGYLGNPRRLDDSPTTAPSSRPTRPN